MDKLISEILENRLDAAKAAPTSCCAIEIEPNAG